MMRGPGIGLVAVLLIAVAFVAGYVRAGGDRFAGAHAWSSESGSAYDATYAALRATPLDERAVLLARHFERADRSDLEAITRAYESTHIGTGPGMVEATLLGEIWARHDPAGAIERTATWRTFWIRQMLSPLMRAWARFDLEAARANAASLETEKDRLLAESSIALGRYEAGGDAGWDDYVRDWPYGEDRLVEILMLVVQDEGLPGLFDRIEALPPEAPDALRARLLRQTAGLGGRLDPVPTSDFVEAHAGDEVEGLRNLMSPFVDAWAQSDPRAALEWLLSQPFSGQRTAATRVAFRPWMVGPEGQIEAIEWLDGQPEQVVSPVRDLYAMALVQQGSHERALEVAGEIQGPNRENVLGRVRRAIAAQEKRAQAEAETADRRRRVQNQNAEPSVSPGAER